MIPPRKTTLAERKRGLAAVEKLLGPPDDRIGLPPTAQREAAEIARARMAEDRPPAPAMVADAARYAAALGLTKEGGRWRGQCIECALPDSLTLTPRAQRVECSCDSGICNVFEIEAAIDGRLSQLGVMGFRSWSWKAAALALKKGGVA
jgi:hypothetical protein